MLKKQYIKKDNICTRQFRYSVTNEVQDTRKLMITKIKAAKEVKILLEHMEVIFNDGFKYNG
jgi:hypothetical protein